jgi:iron complex outermembrane receptor protein
VVKNKVIFLFFLSLLCLATSLHAQPPGGTIKGRVITTGNNPVSYANVVIKNTGYKTETDEAGFFLFTNLPALHDTLVISSVSIRAYFYPFTLAAGETLNTGILEARYFTVNLQDVEITGRLASSYKSDYTFAATKTQAALKNVPQSVSTVTKELMHDKMEFNLKDAMENVAGAGQYSGFDEYTIRGFRAENPHLINGLRSYNTTLTVPLLSNIERVEVIKGPVSVLYGNADPGGTINLVTKKPLDYNEFAFDVYRGSWNDTRGLADVTGPLNHSKTFLYRFNAGFKNAGSFRGQYFGRAFQLAPSFSFIPNKKIKLNADFSLSNTNTIADRGQPGIEGNNNLRNTAIGLSVTQPGDHLNETSISSIVSLSWKISDHISFSSAALNYITRQQLTEHGISSYITPDSVNLYYTSKTFNTVTNTISNFASFTFKTGSISHQILAGYDFINSTVKQNIFRGELPGQFGAESGIVGTMSLLHPQHIKRPVNTYQESDVEGLDDANQYATQGTYVQEQLSYKKWQLLLSLRGEFYTAPADENDSTGDTNEKVLLPRLALTYTLSPAVSVYGSYNNGFDPSEVSVNQQFYNNALKPIYSQLYEVGAKADLFKNQLSATLALYQLTLRNVAVNANDPANPDLFVQRGKERARGVETEIDGNLLTNLSVKVSYAYNVAKVIESEVPAEKDVIKENAPRNASSSWIKYSFTKGFVKGFSLSAGHSQSGSRNTLTTGLVLPAYCVIHAGIGYTFKKFKAALNIYNIGNAIYWTGGYNYASKWPGAPRNAMLNLSYSLGR